MQATLTQLRRNLGLVMGSVVHGGKTVEITCAGKVVASVVPRPQGMSGVEFAKLWRNRRRLGPELAGEVMKSIEEMNTIDEAHFNQMGISTLNPMASKKHSKQPST